MCVGIGWNWEVGLGREVEVDWGNQGSIGCTVVAKYTDNHIREDVVVAVVVMTGVVVVVLGSTCELGRDMVGTD